VREPDVDEGRHGREPPGRVERLGNRAGLDDLAETETFDDAGGQPAEGLVVVHHQHVRAHPGIVVHAGTSKGRVNPTSGVRPRGPGAGPPRAEGAPPRARRPRGAPPLPGPHTACSADATASATGSTACSTTPVRAGARCSSCAARWAPARPRSSTTWASGRR